MCSESPILLVTAAFDRQPANFDPTQMGTRDLVHYAARDGLSIPTSVTRPARTTPGPLPTIVFVHGGPWLCGAHGKWDTDAQFVASRGDLVIEPQFRGFRSEAVHCRISPVGSGAAGRFGQVAQWAIKQGYAHPRRIAIMGASSKRCGFSYALRDSIGSLRVSGICDVQ